MNEAAAAVVIELAREFIEMLRSLGLEWDNGYFRFVHEGLNYGSNASYVVGSKATLIDTFEYESTFDSMNENGVKLLELLGKQQGTFLMTVDSKFDYKIQFEFQNLSRWRITKLDGGTGVPEGL